MAGVCHKVVVLIPTQRWGEFATAVYAFDGVRAASRASQPTGDALAIPGWEAYRSPGFFDEMLADGPTAPTLRVDDASDNPADG